MKNSEIINQNKNAVGFLDLLIPDTSNPNQAQRSIRGTGFIVFNDGKFVTNAHVYLQIPEKDREFLGFNVISSTDEKKIIMYSRYSIELIKLDQENDLALFKIKSNEQKFSTVKSLGDLNEIEEGEEMIILGFPLATELIIMGYGITSVANNCIISSIKRKMQDGSLHFFLIDIHINLGASGSPIFSKNSGDVIGVVSGRIGMMVPSQDGKNIEIPANIGLCRPVNYLRELIK